MSTLKIKPLGTLDVSGFLQDGHIGHTRDGGLIIWDDICCNNLIVLTKIFIMYEKSYSKLTIYPRNLQKYAQIILKRE